MKFSLIFWPPLSAAIFINLMSCGVMTPKIQEVWDVDIPANSLPDLPAAYTASSRLSYEVQRRIYCDVKEGVTLASTIPVSHGETLENAKIIRGGLFPEGWGVQVSINLQVEESFALNPGVSLVSPLANAVSNAGSARPVVTPQSSSVGFGATLSSAATTTNKVVPYWSVRELIGIPKKKSKCEIDPSTGVFKNDPFDIAHVPKINSSPFITDSDLGIKEWIVGEMINWTLMKGEGKGPYKGDSKGPGPNIISREFNFVIVTAANATPSWKLARVTANTGGPFLGVDRTKTHGAIITIGPQDEKTNQTFFASQIGQEVRRRF